MNFPASRLRPVSGQLRGYAGVVHDAVVSDCHRKVHSIHEDAYVSSSQRT